MLECGGLSDKTIIMELLICIGLKSQYQINNGQQWFAAISLFFHGFRI
jgi:hypothetical protein